MSKQEAMETVSIRIPSRMKRFLELAEADPTAYIERSILECFRSDLDAQIWSHEDIIPAKRKPD